MEGALEDPMNLDNWLPFLQSILVSLSRVEFFLQKKEPLPTKVFVFN